MIKGNEYIILHHSLVSREKNFAQFKAIDGFHKRKGWGKIGYHYLIEPNGEVKKGREHHEVGAHCREKLMNYRSIGICLAGNFDIEEPTNKQKASLLKLLNELQDTYGIPDHKVCLHRQFAPYKSCMGSRIPNDIRMYLDLEDKTPTWAGKAVEWGKDLKLTNGEHINEPLTKAEMLTILYRYNKLSNH